MSLTVSELMSLSLFQARGADAGEAGREKGARAGGRGREGEAAEEAGPRAAADPPKNSG